MGDIIDLYEGIKVLDNKINILVDMLQKKGVIDIEVKDDDEQAHKKSK